MMAGRILELDVFGRRMLVAREGSRWVCYYLGSAGKRRRAVDLVIPSDLDEEELSTYLADAFHEAASERYPGVKVVDK